MKQKPFWFFWLLLLTVVQLAAQDRRADSLHVFSLINKAEDHFTESNYDSALYYCGLANTYSQAKNFRKGQAFSLIETADIYIEKDDLKKADETAEAVVKIGLQTKDSLVTAVGWMQQAQIHMYSDRFDAAVALFDKSLQHYLGKHPTRYSALAYNDLGYTWGRKGNSASRRIAW